MPRTSTRWATESDLAAILKIEQDSYSSPWQEKDFTKLLAVQPTNYVCRLAESCEGVIGYVVYEIQPNCLEIVNLTVCPDHRYGGIGSGLVSKVIQSATNVKKKKVTIMVPERNLDAQLFLRKIGFKCTMVDHEVFGDDDGFFMEVKIARKS